MTPVCPKNKRLALHAISPRSASDDALHSPALTHLAEPVYSEHRGLGQSYAARPVLRFLYLQMVACGNNGDARGGSSAFRRNLWLRFRRFESAMPVAASCSLAIEKGGFFGNLGKSIQKPYSLANIGWIQSGQERTSCIFSYAFIYLVKGYLEKINWYSTMYMCSEGILSKGKKDAHRRGSRTTNIQCGSKTESFRRHYFHGPWGRTTNRSSLTVILHAQYLPGTTHHAMP